MKHVVRVVAYAVIVFGMVFMVIGMAILSGCSWLLDRLGVENPVEEIIANDFHY